MTDHLEGHSDLGGRVIFAGAGPANPYLLTIAVARFLRDADLVLLAREGLQHLVSGDPVSSQAEVCVVAMGEEWPEQAWQIVAEGGLVVRLMDDDPLIQGAGEEAARCRTRGVSFEIAPGVWSMTAVPEYAGLALRTSAGVQFFALNDCQQLGEIAPTGTVVVETRPECIEEVVSSALTSGRDASEPVTVIVDGATINQSSKTTTLGKLTSASFRLPGNSPTEVMLVIGAETGVSTNDGLDWFESKPLFGWKILVPRTKDPVDGLIERLGIYGACAVEVPTMAVEPPRSPQQLERAIHGLVEGRYGWIIFTSPASVRAIRERFEDVGLDARALSGIKVASVGQGTTEELREVGIIPDLVPHSGDSVADLASDFPLFDDMFDAIDRVFVPRADIATEELTEGLAILGWEVEEVVAARTVRAAPPSADIREAIKTGEFDAVAFVSSTAVRNLVGIAGKPHQASVIAAIGSATAQTCDEHGLEVKAVADVTTQASLADALARFASEREADFANRGKPVVRPSQQRRARRKAAA